MRNIIIVVIVAVVALGIWMMSRAGDAKPGPASASQTNPGAVLADSVSNDLDFRTRATLEVRILSQDRDFKQLLAMGSAVDEETAKSELQSYDQLQQDVTKGREDLIHTGSSAQAVDTWLAKINWPEVGDLAGQVRSKLQQSAAPQ